MRVRLAKKILADPGRYSYVLRIKAWQRVTRREWRHNRPKRRASKKWWERTSENVLLDSARDVHTELLAKVANHFRRYPNPFEGECDVCEELERLKEGRRRTK